MVCGGSLHGRKSLCWICSTGEFSSDGESNNSVPAAIVMQAQAAQPVTVTAVKNDGVSATTNNTVTNNVVANDVAAQEVLKQKQQYQAEN